MRKFRRFNWCSSIDIVRSAELEKLNQSLNDYYSKSSLRSAYNEILDRKSQEFPMVLAEGKFIEWLNSQNFKNICEIGCGHGWMSIRVENLKKDISYHGMEVSKDVIEANRKRWPWANWFVGSIYQPPFKLESFDLVFSIYVLEHLVYPLEGLEAMYNLVEIGGAIVLVFPDFVQNKRLPSQQMGWGLERNAIKKLKKGRILDALLSLIDSRLLLPAKLRIVHKKVGSFMVNLSPICFDPDYKEVWSDADAVYIANKREIEHWARTKEMQVEFPFGREGYFMQHSFMVLRK